MAGVSGVPPAFDPSVLAGLLGDDPEAVAEIVGEYVADAPRQLVRLREALAAGDTDQVRRLAHTLKGASANIGAEGARAAALALEQAAAGSFDQGGAPVEAVEAELQRLLEAVKAAGVVP